MTLLEYSSAKYASAGYPLYFLGLLRFSARWPAPVHRARDTVTMLHRETPKCIHPEMWPPNSPDLNPVDYSIWDMLQEKVYCWRIHDVKELKDDAADDDDDVC